MGGNSHLLTSHSQLLILVHCARYGMSSSLNTRSPSPPRLRNLKNAITPSAASTLMLQSLHQPLKRLLRCLQVVPRRLKHLLPSMASGKLDTPHFRALLTPELQKLESLFRSNGYGFRLVGGVVRDLLLEQPAKDIDIATECTPDDMITIFMQNGIRYIPTGLQHGTVTVHLNSTDYEITTLRVDKETDGRHATVDFTKDWRLDALRRDLTINAMSLELDGTLYDYFGGQQHLAERKVAFVGDARTRIQEDYLRCGGWSDDGRFPGV